MAGFGNSQLHSHPQNIGGSRQAPEDLHSGAEPGRGKLCRPREYGEKFVRFHSWHAANVGSTLSFSIRTPTGFQGRSAWQFFGLGISVANINGQPTVISTLPGTPAHRLGIRSGDIIVKIDGKPGIRTDTEPSSRKTPRAEGDRGSDFCAAGRHWRSAGLHRYTGCDSRHSVPVAVYLRPKTGYIRIEDFTETTERELEEALKKLGPELEGLILDLRGNPGGALQAAIGVADKFLKQGQDVIADQRAPRQRQSSLRCSEGSRQ